MQWEVLLVPLIAMAVWIIGSLMRGSIEEKKRNESRPASGNGGSPTSRPSRQKQPNDLQQFLEEVQRRRQTSEQQPAEAPPEPSRPGPEPIERRPKPRPAGQQKRQPRPSAPSPTRRPRPRATNEPGVVDLVVVEETRMVEAQPPLAIPVAGAIVPMAVPPPAPVVSRDREKNLSPSLVALLRTREALRNAIILREIFDPPLCKRKKG